MFYLGSSLDNEIKSIRSSSTKDLRTKFNLKKDDLVIGFVGRLVRWKGPKFLLDAFLKIDNPKVKLVYFGTGSGQSESVEESLKKQVEKMGIQDRVIFFGFLENRALIYKLIDIFVLSSVKAEPFSTTVIEAALCKCPIIATNIGGTPEFIKHSKNGLLVTPGNVGALAKLLLRLIEDQRFARNLGKIAFQDAKAFKIDNITRNLEEIYIKLI